MYSFFLVYKNNLSLLVILMWCDIVIIPSFTASIIFSFSSLHIFIRLFNLTSGHPHSLFLFPVYRSFFFFSCFFTCLILFCWKLNFFDNFVAALDTGCPVPAVLMLIIICCVTGWINLVKFISRQCGDCCCSSWATVLGMPAVTLGWQWFVFFSHTAELH